VIFFNGKDNFDYVWTIDNIDKKEVKFVLFDTLFNKSEIDFTLNLYQALPNKLEKIEYLLQK
jgi:16S rRNA U1498 N3-methylase RsmE